MIRTTLRLPLVIVASGISCVTITASIRAERPEVLERQILEATNAFRKDQLSWLQAAEHSIDSFMISTRGRA